jgi:hypothetical protein
MASNRRVPLLVLPPSAARLLARPLHNGDVAKEHAPGRVGHTREVATAGNGRQEGRERGWASEGQRALLAEGRRGRKRAAMCCDARRCTAQQARAFLLAKAASKQHAPPPCPPCATPAADGGHLAALRLPALPTPAHAQPRCHALGGRRVAVRVAQLRGSCPQKALVGSGAAAHCHLRPHSGQRMGVVPAYSSRHQQSNRRRQAKL